MQTISEVPLLHLFNSSYYFVGKAAHISQYIDARNFDTFTTKLVAVKDTIKKSKYPNLTPWVGKTADASSHGTANVSDRYVSGFLWVIIVHYVEETLPFFFYTLSNMLYPTAEHNEPYSQETTSLMKKP